MSREHIPSDELAALRWLDDDLDYVLAAAHIGDHAAADRERFLKAMGDVAELFVFEALARAKRHPVHVALTSDSYGHDVETRVPDVTRIEVKAAGVTTRGSFHLSRDEYDKRRIYGDQWRLYQVVFSESALNAEILDHTHVDGVFELASDALATDTPSFKWTESAVIKPPPDCWRTAPLTLDPTFTTPGFKHRAHHVDH